MTDVITTSTTPTEAATDTDIDIDLGPIHTTAHAFPPPTLRIHTRERPLAADPAYGLHTWPSARKLARCLHRLGTQRHPGLFRGRGVVELGCGTALPGLLLAHPAMGARRVLLTDRADAPHVLANVRAAVALNFNGPSASSSSDIRIAPLTWGAFPLTLPFDDEGAGAFDALVAADCCYRDGEGEGNEPFLATVTHLLRRAAARRKKQQPQPQNDEHESYFPVLFLAYPERGEGAALRVAMRRWGLEVRGMAMDDDEEEGVDGDGGDEEGYRVHCVEVRLKGSG